MEAKCRVLTFLPNLEYIKLKRGEEGVKSVMLELWKRGYHYDFRKMKKTDWVPVVVRKEFLEVVMDVLGWDERNIYEMGLNAPRISPVIKLFFGLFLSMERAFKAAPDMWKAHYSSGTLRVGEYRDGHGTIILENFDISPIFCEYLKGYFTGVAKLTKAKNLRVEETKCTFKGDEYHEYTFDWKP